MLTGARVVLRARTQADLPVLHAELYDDALLRSRTDSRPWQPIAADSPDSPFAANAQRENAASFAVVERATGELAGAASVWGIDAHNRAAHLGLTLRPDFRGRGLGTDVLRVLCEYGFRLRGLQRLQVETLADNAAMLGSAARAGFVVEGRLRASAWVAGEFLDEVVLGLLAADRRPAGP